MPPNEEEIKLLISELKNNKSTSEDEIIAEFIKLAGDKTAFGIVEIIKEFGKQRKFPQNGRQP